jgi:hypothetical protein
MFVLFLIWKILGEAGFASKYEEPERPAYATNYGSAVIGWDPTSSSELTF